MSFMVPDNGNPTTTGERLIEVLYCPSCGKGCLQFSNDLMVERWKWFPAKLNIFEDSK